MCSGGTLGWRWLLPDAGHEVASSCCGAAQKPDSRYSNLDWDVGQLFQIRTQVNDKTMTFLADLSLAHLQVQVVTNA